MIKHKCKVVIFDHRTKVLRKIIQDKISSNYLSAGVGNILVPGWSIPPKSDIRKKIWVPGFYYSPTSEILINGKRVKRHLLELEQKTYEFSNPTGRPVYFYYIFDEEKFSQLIRKQTRT
jgi:hypothetical protein